ncbi:hypothetical protein F4861DRAFT_547770 [Xylaria intraflava]|nr:hypothetical protein F4861DRAFT_547770 [Xylaria intraflava]
MSSPQNHRSLAIERVLATPAGSSQFESLTLILRLIPLAGERAIFEMDLDRSLSLDCRATKHADMKGGCANRVSSKPRVYLFRVKEDPEEMKTYLFKPGLYCIVETDFTLWDMYIPHLEFHLTSNLPSRKQDSFKGLYETQREVGWAGRSITTHFDDAMQKAYLDALLIEGADIHSSHWRDRIAALVQVFRPSDEQDKHLKVVRDDLKMLKEKMAYLEAMTKDLQELEANLELERKNRVRENGVKRWGSDPSSEIPEELNQNRKIKAMGFSMVTYSSMSVKTWCNHF